MLNQMCVIRNSKFATLGGSQNMLLTVVDSLDVWKFKRVDTRSSVADILMCFCRGNSVPARNQPIIGQ